MQFSKLDVACGFRPVGDVNCDLYVTDVFNHRAFGVGNRLDVRRIPNFVVCEGCHLPFRDKAFDEVHCAQLIEHLVKPQVLMVELVRVCSRTLVVETCHWLGERFQGLCARSSSRWFREHHVSKFNFSWFGSVARLYGLRVVRSYVLSWYCFPSEWMTLFRVPYEIGVEFAV